MIVYDITLYGLRNISLNRLLANGSFYLCLTQCPKFRNQGWTAQMLVHFIFIKVQGSLFFVFSDLASLQQIRLLELGRPYYVEWATL